MMEIARYSTCSTESQLIFDKEDSMHKEGKADKEVKEDRERRFRTCLEH